MLPNIGFREKPFTNGHLWNKQIVLTLPLCNGFLDHIKSRLLHLATSV